MALKTEESRSIYDLDHHWISQKNKTITLKDLIGAPMIVTMIFTHCPGACPLIVSEIKSFDRQLSKQEKKKIKFVVFSIDPVRDRPQALELFYKKMSLDNRWTLLTSDNEQVREMAAVLGFGYKDIGGGDFTHSRTLFLISAQGQILVREEGDSDWKEFLAKFRTEISKVKK